MQPKWSTKLVWIIVGANAAVVVGCIWLAMSGKLITTISRIDWSLLTAGVVALLIGIVFDTVRWRYVLGNKPSLATVFHTSSLGYLVNNLTPILVPATRVYLIGKVSPVSTSEATSGAVVERTLEVVMRVLVALLVPLFYARARLNNGDIGISLLVVAGVLGMIMWATYRTHLTTTKLAGWLRFLPQLSHERAHRIAFGLVEGLTEAGAARRLIVGMLISLVMWGFFFVFHYQTVLALPITLTTQSGIALALGSLALVPPSAPAMPGLFQVSLVGPLAVFGLMDVSTLIIYAVVLHALQVVVWLILSVWAFRELDIGFSQLLSVSNKTANIADVPVES